MKMRTEGQIARGAVQRDSTLDGPPSESQTKQYSLAKILGIRTAAALPMGLIVWRITPFLIPRVELHAGLLGRALITLRQGWRSGLSYIIL